MMESSSLENNTVSFLFFLVFLRFGHFLSVLLQSQTHHSSVPWRGGGCIRAAGGNVEERCDFIIFANMKQMCGRAMAGAGACVTQALDHLCLAASRCQQHTRPGGLQRDRAARAPQARRCSRRWHSVRVRAARAATARATRV